MKNSLKGSAECLTIMLLATLQLAGCRQASPPPEAAAESSPPGIQDASPSPSASATAADEQSATAAPAAMPPSVAGDGPIVGDGRPTPARTETAALALAPVEIDLPAPAFRGTPVPRDEPFVEEPSGSPRPPFLAPEGTTNLALAKPVTCSDLTPPAGEVDLVTDGGKDASDFDYLELGPGTQWVQIDLTQRATIYAVVVWHSHAEARVYRDVVLQVSDDPDFLQATTVFNNDYDNSSGLGIGDALGYVETSEGRLIDCRGVEGRYVRLYSRGNHLDAGNHYTEVDVYGS